MADWTLVVLAFYFTTAVAFGCNFLCFILSLLCRIKGVGLALKGPGPFQARGQGRGKGLATKKLLTMA